VVSALAAGFGVFVPATAGAGPLEGLKEYAAQFEAQCAEQGGPLEGALKVSIKATALANVSPGQELSFSGGSTTFSTSTAFSNQLVAAGITSVRSAVIHLPVDTTGLEPATINIVAGAGTAITVPEAGKEMTFTAPASGRTFSIGPFKVTGALGGTARLVMDSSPAFEEGFAPGEVLATGHGIRLTMTVRNAGGAGGETALLCTAPANAALAELPIETPPPPPTVTAIQPNHGGKAGGTAVTITGTNFTEVLAVKFGEVQATSFKTESGTRITAVSPPGLGTVDVGVITRGGFSALSAADRFSYPQKAEYGAHFEAPCAEQGGHLLGAAKVAIKATALSSTAPGEELQFSEASTTFSTPVAFSNQLVAAGVTKVEGKVTRLPVDATGLEPAAINIGEPPEDSTGLPYSAVPESGKEMVIAAPFNGGTYNFGPLKVTGALGSTAKLVMDSSPAFLEIEGAGANPTGEGINIAITYLKGTESVGGSTLLCTAPANVALAEVPIPPPAPTVTKVEPSHGSTAGGTSVTITGTNFIGVTAVKFGSVEATSFKAQSGTSLTAVAPPGANTVDVTVTNAGGTSVTTPADQFTYVSPIEKAEYKNWVLSGSLTDKKLGQAITLPAGATFNGSGEVNAETGAGSVNGNLSIPSFTTTLSLFGVLHVGLGITLTQVAPLEGTLGRSETVPGDELLTLPARLKLGVTSVSLLGLTIPTRCATAEPLSLSLADTLTREELLTKGWSFAGTTALPSFTCEGGFLGFLFGQVLSGLLSGPENSYSLGIKAPSG
jgi:hypothetical protein